MYEYYQKKKKERKEKWSNSKPLRIRHRLPHPSCKLPEVLIGDSVAQKNYKNYEVGYSDKMNFQQDHRKQKMKEYATVLLTSQLPISISILNFHVHIQTQGMENQ